MDKTILAIEWSSTRLSVAWQKGDSTREEHCDMKRFQAEQALPMLEKFIAELSDIREIRIGRGPGNYSGIRQSLAWAIGYCAPGDVQLTTCSSGDAQAYRLQKSVSESFAVLGDARRGVWWGKFFPEANENWELKKPEAWMEILCDRSVFSQEAMRLQNEMPDIQPDYPTAMDLLDLPADRLSRDLSPLYLHPAV